MKKKQALWENVFTYFGLTIVMFTFIFLIYTGVSMYLDGNFSLESTANKFIQPTEQFGHSQVISEDKGIAFINYNCVTRRDCRGQYILSFDRINKTWVLNESSKNVLW